MISVQRSSWKPEYLALICGIANAGGGTLTIIHTESKKTSSMLDVPRLFENVLTLTQESLGFACSTEPVMVNGQLCTEIVIPATAEPLRYKGTYYLWRNGKNDLVSEQEVEEAIEERQGASPSKPDASEDAQAKYVVPESVAKSNSFAEKSIAAANDLDLTAVDENVIKVLSVNGRATAARIAEFLGVSESTVHRSYKKLRGLGIIRRVGSNKAGYWKVLI